MYMYLVRCVSINAFLPDTIDLVRLCTVCLLVILPSTQEESSKSVLSRKFGRHTIMLVNDFSVCFNLVRSCEGCSDCY